MVKLSYTKLKYTTHEHDERPSSRKRRKKKYRMFSSSSWQMDKKFIYDNWNKFAGILFGT